MHSLRSEVYDYTITGAEPNAGNSRCLLTSNASVPASTHRVQQPSDVAQPHPDRPTNQSQKAGLSSLAIQQSNLSTPFNWNPTTLVGKKRKAAPSSQGKRKKLPTWTHTFVCLTSASQDTLPDGQERAELQIAGLGEKRISLSAYADAQDIYHELTFQFPKLSNSGGFELLWVSEGGKQLDVIASPANGYTVSYLRVVIHHAKIFIRPLQKDLSLEALKEPVCC